MARGGSPGDTWAGGELTQLLWEGLISLAALTGSHAVAHWGPVVREKPGQEPGCSPDPCCLLAPPGSSHCPARRLAEWELCARGLPALFHSLNPCGSAGEVGAKAPRVQAAATSQRAAFPAQGLRTHEGDPAGPQHGEVTQSRQAVTRGCRVTVVETAPGGREPGGLHRGGLHVLSLEGGERISG